jgi:hypothetical protein
MQADRSQKPDRSRSENRHAGHQYALLTWIYRPWARSWLRWLAVAAVLAIIVGIAIPGLGDVFIACALVAIVLVVAANDMAHRRDDRRVRQLSQSGSVAFGNWAPGSIEAQSGSAREFEPRDLHMRRPTPPYIGLWRVAASRAMLRYSRDRSTLNLLLTINDLPAVWRQKRELWYRAGLLHGDNLERRARREKLIYAAREFVSPETRSYMRVSAVPYATDDDARAALATVEKRHFRRDWFAHIVEELEVTPPPEAGEHARAWLRKAIGRDGTSHTLNAIWQEPGALLLDITYTAPPEVRVYDLASALIQCQRQRLASQTTQGAADF